MRLVNRFENEIIELKNVASVLVAPKFKEIRVCYKNGICKAFSAVTYELVED